ncbi:hypothetical protein CEV32_0763 [Brucella rhizosphaerae]|uniref:Uncharacterized protein n=1 Tax=Brucella rhizosphaerae TaxID=571254 RepID=A0A256FCK2_9HYPH|nr:hypothetical protein CEV32_0763 [Brucella rhizosphaerae]
MFVDDFSKEVPLERNRQAAFHSMSYRTQNCFALTLEIF